MPKQKKQQSMERTHLLVANKICNECLLSNKKIVPNSDQQAIINECIKKGIGFVCHKATIAGKHIYCRGFFNAYPGQLVFSLARDLGLVVYVDLPEEKESNNDLQ